MNIKINFLNLARQLLPPHKRQPVRMKLLQGFFAPLYSLLRHSINGVVIPG